MGVGIPGTGMVGLPIAIALGTLIGKSAYGLEVLRDLTPEALTEGKQVIEDKRIHIALKDNVDKLYIEVICSAGDETSRVIICHEHTNIVYVEKNGVVLTDRRKEGVSCDVLDDDELRLSFSTVYEFAMEMPLILVRSQTFSLQHGCRLIAISMYVMMVILIGMKDMQMVMLPVRSGVLPKLLPICGQIAIRNMIT